MGQWQEDTVGALLHWDTAVMQPNQRKSQADLCFQWYRGGHSWGAPHGHCSQASRKLGMGSCPLCFHNGFSVPHCAMLQPRSQHNLQTHWAMILLGKNSSNMSYKPTQCPKNLISSVSTLLQILLQAVCSRELLLLFPSGGSSPNSTWVLSGQNTAVVPCKYSNLAAFDTKFIIKNYFC